MMRALGAVSFRRSAATVGGASAFKGIEAIVIEIPAAANSPHRPVQLSCFNSLARNSCGSRRESDRPANPGRPSFSPAAPLPCRFRTRTHACPDNNRADSDDLPPCHIRNSSAASRAAPDSAPRICMLPEQDRRTGLGRASQAPDEDPALRLFRLPPGSRPPPVPCSSNDPRCTLLRADCHCPLTNCRTSATGTPAL